MGSGDLRDATGTVRQDGQQPVLATAKLPSGAFGKLVSPVAAETQMSSPGQWG
jgi:hypothetical protein